MVVSTTVGGIAALLASGGYLLRRKISRNWITRSSIMMIAAQNQNQQQLAKDQTIIITGGNTGVGYETAKDLATIHSTGKIILACRNDDAGKRAALQIRQHSGNENVGCMKLDLSSLESVREFAKELKAREDDTKVCALICNAGVWMPPEEEGVVQKKKTREGFEVHFGVNHLGHFALIRSLLPLMEQSGMEDGRIVIVGSTLCKSGKIDLQKRDFVYDGRIPGADGKRSFAPMGYCDSKLMNMLTSRELAARLQESQSNVTTYCVSPGFCQSQLGRNTQLPFYKRILMRPLMRFFQRSSNQGAQNIIFTVTEDKSKLVSGAMYQDGVIWEDGVKLMDTLGDDLQKGLWDLSEELIKEKDES
mmetsp:Transcript_8240/g.15404  ORF Transcript_8240/g.15404 Transcript_8240/m.15404 type:complete len:362 (-) Transcript_8240:92-1177(-)|eukprot:CAMPEP_0196133978 /NCGR_PEP_ID=MMETSP0910-20130528/2993_1 /TAXON_ID=49265 /ORGANISM="Thalassiosira rotula, Strain GSO102" /LENGTH=361 /DNA_ID=CAMNT_0041393765 /DNA_START=51 /DNA_END=1136 /DNA_ORIENTATION=-